MFKGFTLKDWVIGYFTLGIWILYKMHKNGVPIVKVLGGFVGVYVLIGVLGGIFGDKDKNKSSNTETETVVVEKKVDNAEKERLAKEKAEADRIAKEEEAKKKAESERIEKEKADADTIANQYSISGVAKESTGICKTEELAAEFYGMIAFNISDRPIEMLNNGDCIGVPPGKVSLYFKRESYDFEHKFFKKLFEKTIFRFPDGSYSDIFYVHTSYIKDVN